MRISDLVVHNDHQLIAFNKPGGMPSQDDKTGDASLHRLACAYCKRDVYIIQRIDRPCSGLVVFAKSTEAARYLSDQWQQREVKKKYLAIISQGLVPETGHLEHALLKVGNKSVVAEADQQNARKAGLDYRIIKRSDNYDILEVITTTGYFHQVRAQLSAAGFPVKDDVKYGARRSNKDRTISLHCVEMTFRHPGNNQMLTLYCPPPDDVLWNILN